MKEMQLACGEQTGPWEAGCPGWEGTGPWAGSPPMDRSVGARRPVLRASFPLQKQGSTSLSTRSPASLILSGAEAWINGLCYSLYILGSQFFRFPACVCV